MFGPVQSEEVVHYDWEKMQPRLLPKQVIPEIAGQLTFLHDSGVVYNNLRLNNVVLIIAIDV